MSEHKNVKVGDMFVNRNTGNYDGEIIYHIVIDITIISYMRRSSQSAMNCIPVDFTFLTKMTGSECDDEL